MKTLAVLVLVALAIGPALGQFGKAKAPPRAPATASDVQYILCQVCEAFVKEAIAGVKQLRVEEKPGHMMTESDIIERLEKACSPDESAGEWIRNYDLQEDGTKLKLVDMKEGGECEVECRTIARACEKVHEKMDLSDLSEMLWKKEGRSAITQVVCRDQTGACNKKPPPLPKDRPVGTPFVKMDPEKLQREKLMRSMKAAGLSGSMYDRETMEKMTAGGGMPGMERDEDDDDDEIDAPGPGFQKLEL